MTARAFLIRGLIAGLLAGIAAFVVAYSVGEPYVQKAIDIEESSAAPAIPHSESQSFSVNQAAVLTHDGGHEEDGTVVSRDNQRTWGLLTGTLGIGTALGAIVGLVAAGLVGRIGRWSPGQSTAFAALGGYVAVALVPFLKYPANPPAVGNADTIGHRTTLYFVFLLISILALVAATALGQRLWEHRRHVRRGGLRGRPLPPGHGPGRGTDALRQRARRLPRRHALGLPSLLDAHPGDHVGRHRSAAGRDGRQALPRDDDRHAATRAGGQPVTDVRPPSPEATALAQERLDGLATPPGALGRLGDLAVWIAGAQGKVPPELLTNVRLVIFAGDHGVAAHGVSAYPPAITGAMVRTFVAGKAGVSALAAAHDVHVRVLDLGVDEDLADVPAEVRAHKVRRGSGAIHLEDALTPEETARALEAGRQVALEEIAAGAQLLISGDMGIGNTTPAAALIAAALGLPASEVTGRGTGIDEAALAHKESVIDQALARAGERTADPVECLTALGSADLGRSHRLPGGRRRSGRPGAARRRHLGGLCTHR